MNSPVRVRIAPTPTGHLDVGTARTAIFNWLFARHTGGKFLVRINDSGADSAVASLVQPILNAMKWVGLDWDEAVVYRSQRTRTYIDFGNTLLKSGHAYRCFCTPTESDAERKAAQAAKLPPGCSRKCLNLSAGEVQARIDASAPFAIRLLVPEGETVYNDLVSGEIRCKNDEVENFVVMRSDGSATIDFSTVIDDHEMRITHVLGGSDHVTDILTQIHLYRALGWEVPEFGRLPHIAAPDGHEFSDRFREKDMATYRNEGILPGAMFNYLSMLGRSTGTEREIYSAGELIEIFDLHRLNSSQVIFDEGKLVTFNKAHIQMTSDHDLAVLVAPMLVDAGATSKYWLETRWVYLRKVISMLKEQARRVSDFVSLGSYFFSFEGNYDSEAAAKLFNLDSADLLESLAERFEKLDDFTHETIEKVLESLADERGLKKARLFHPIRLAVSGMSAGPELCDVLVVLTKPVVVARMKKAVEYIRRNHQITPQG